MLFTKTLGPFEKPSLVFLHGFLGDHADFFPLAHELKEEFCLHFIDLPGHGKSPFPNEDPKSCIRHTIAHLCKGAPYHLIGYSMGGRIASKIAPSDPLCQSLILLSAHPGLTTDEEKKQREAQDLLWCELLEKLPFPDFLQKWYSQTLFLPLRRRKRLFEKMLQKRSRNEPKKLIQAMKAFSLASDTATWHFDKPTLALYGEYDKSYCKLYTKLTETVQVIAIDSSGHVLPLENPKACAHNIRYFLKERLCTSNG